MSAKKVFILISIVIIAFGYLAISTREALLYYYTIEEAGEKLSTYPSTAVRIRGQVKQGSVSRDPNNPETVLFTIYDKDKCILVDYTGTLPGLFGDDAPVVVEGKLISKTELQADKILTKCPSKYE